MRLKRIGTAVLMLALTLALAAGCGGKGGQGGTGDGSGTTSGGGNHAKGGQTETAGINKDAVWREQLLDLGASGYDAENLNGGMVFADGKLYLFGNRESYEGDKYSSDVFVIRCNPDGSGMETVILDNPAQGVWYTSFCVGDDGAMYAVKNEYPEGVYEMDTASSFSYGEGFDDMTGAEAVEIADGDVEIITDGASDAGEDSSTADADSETADDDAGNDADAYEDAFFGDGQMERYYIVKFDASGEKQYEAELKQATDNPDGWYGVNGMQFAQGKILLSDNQGISVYNPDDGTHETVILKTDSYPMISVSGAGEPCVTYWDDEGTVLVPLDPGNGKAGEKTMFPTAMLLYDTGNMRPGITSDFLVTDSGGISTWNVGDEKPVQILNMVDSDLNLDYFEAFVQTAEDEIVAMYYHADAGRVCARLTKVDPADIKDRGTLVLACNYLDQSLRKAIVHFNQTNEDYRITINDYSRYITEDAWDAGYTQLNNDIISGNAPDIMVLDSGHYTRIYQTKGLLEPLDSYMENDPEISKTEYVDNVFDAYRYKGQLYLLTPAFMTRTYAIKASDAAKISEWSLDELQRMAEERNIDYMKIFGDWPMSQNDVVLMALVFDGKNYFDWDEHRVKFDGQSFIDLLHFAKQFPQEIDYAAYDEDTSGYFRTGEAIVAQAWLGSFSDFRRLKYGTFGEDISFIGFPREEGKGGSSVMATTQFAISSESNNKEAAWSFLRTFLTDDYQNQVAQEMGYAFPVSRKHLEQMGKDAMRPETYTDEDGEEVIIDELFWINNEEIKLETLTEADLRQVMELFDTLDSGYDYDETLMNMVQEEIAPFFEGQKTAEECAKILQSKAQIYIDENS